MLEIKLIPFTQSTFLSGTSGSYNLRIFGIAINFKIGLDVSIRVVSTVAEPKLRMVVHYLLGSKS